MNKLEQLKALIAEENKWRREWINAEMALDACEDVWSLRQKYYSAKRNRAALSDDLLPQLVAVAEAAQCIRHWHDVEPDGMIVSAEHVRLLWGELEPLTKDTDKGKGNCQKHIITATGTSGAR